MTKPADFDAIARLIDQLLAARAAEPSTLGGSVPAA
jgi:hypothetical protein